MFLLPLGSSCVNIFVNIVFWFFFRCSFFLHVQALSIGGTVTKRCRTQRDSLTWNCGGFFQYGTFYRNKVCIFSQKKHRVCDACGFPWKTELDTRFCFFSFSSFIAHHTGYTWSSFFFQVEKSRDLCSAPTHRPCELTGATLWAMRGLLWDKAASSFWLRLPARAPLLSLKPTVHSSIK